MARSTRRSSIPPSVVASIKESQANSQANSSSPEELRFHRRRAVREFLADCFVVFVLAVVTIDSFPFGHQEFPSFPLQQKIRTLQRQVRKNILRPVGLEQGIWDVFAPNPAYFSDRYSADLFYENGFVQEWKSLNYTEATLYEWKASSRLLGYMENLLILHADENMRKVTNQTTVFLPLIQYIYQTHPIQAEVEVKSGGDGERPNKRNETLHPTKIILRRHEKKILPPPKNTGNVTDKSWLYWLLGDPLVKRWSEEKTFIILVWRYSSIPLPVEGSVTF